MKSGVRIDEPHDHPHVVAGASQIAFEDGRDSQIAADFPDVDVAVPLGERGRARRDLESFDARERVDQLLRDPVAEIA